MTTDEGTRKPLTEFQEGVRAICGVCGWNVKMMAGRAARLYSSIVAAGGSWLQVEEHYGQVDTGSAWWWYRDDWRGKRGERPADHSLRETWGRWTQPIAVAATQPASWAALEEVRRMRQEALTNGHGNGD